MQSDGERANFEPGIIKRKARISSNELKYNLNNSNGNIRTAKCPFFSFSLDIDDQRELFSEIFFIKSSMVHSC